MSELGQWNQENILILVQWKLAASFAAEGVVPPNRFNLGRERTALQYLSNTTLTVWPATKIDSQENEMIFAAVFTVNRNIVCRHVLPPVLQPCTDGVLKVNARWSSLAFAKWSFNLRSI
jgi:hypothetical protein